METRDLDLEDLLDIVATAGRRVVCQSKQSYRYDRTEGTREKFFSTTAVDIDSGVAYRALHIGKARGLLREAAAENPCAVLLGIRETAHVVRFDDKEKVRTTVPLEHRYFARSENRLPPEDVSLLFASGSARCTA